MAIDLIRPTERAVTVSLKANAPLLAILPKTSIDPQPKTTGVDAQGAPIWPFVVVEAMQSLPQGRGCTAGAEVSLSVHSFAKPRYNAGGAMIETAKDHAARIHSAVVDALHNHAYEVDGRRYGLSVRASRIMRDGAEADAWHGVATVVARAYQG